MRAALEIAGVRFGRLVALRRVATALSGKTIWLCACDCGAEATAQAGNLKSGLTRSCGCLRRETSALTGKARRRAVVGYGGAHRRTVRTRGRASEHTCPCGVPAEQWAYNHADPNEARQTVESHGMTLTLAYSLDPRHYVAMCVPCHAQFDDSHRVTSPA